jgi:hypothetical protein
MSLSNPFQMAHAAALARWDRPFPGFASGHDRRTSDQGLLTLTYGGLAHAARYQWLNAGRRLIDKTYVDMLMQVQGLSDLRSVRPEQIAAALDRFIVDLVQPVWADLAQLSEAERLETAISWVEYLAGNGFGSIYVEHAASRLLFFLCPMLPVFNLGQDRLLALNAEGHPPERPDYRAFAQAAAAAYRAHLPQLATLPPPVPSVADPQQNGLIADLLVHSDWWSRRVFDAYLLGGVVQGGEDSADRFISDDA